MKMELVGMTEVREGTSKKTNKEYMSIDLHFIGRSSMVMGVAVAMVYVDLLKVLNPPEFQLGYIYDVDLSDGGYLRSIELLESRAADSGAKNTEPKDNKQGGQQ